MSPPNNVLVVYKVSTLELFNSSRDQKIAAYLHKHPEEVARLQQSHEEQKKTLETVTNMLSALGVSYESWYRGELRKREIQGFDLVIAVGGDGTLLEVSHYVDTIPILGVNSDTATSVGYFSSASRDSFKDIFQSVENFPRTSINRLEVYVNGELQPDKALNEAIVAYPRPGPSFNFMLTTDGVVSKHRPTYQILITTPAGSTAGAFAMNGPILSLDSPLMGYHILGERINRFDVAQNIAVESLNTKAAIVLDSHYRIPLGFHDVATFALGSPITIIGDIKAKQRAFVAANRAKNVPVTFIGE